MEKVRILIADDDRELASILAEYLQEQPDFEVVGWAENGPRAIELALQRQPDVILLDLIMPYIDGLGVLEALNDAPGDMPRVVMFSALSSAAFIQRAQFLGAMYYIVKPFQLDYLAARLREVAAMPAIRGHEPEGRMLAISDRELEREVTDLLHRLCVPTHLKGYQYLRDAVKMVARDVTLLKGLTTQLYPAIAKAYNSTGSRVERTIRNAIECCWSRAPVGVLESVFGYTVDPKRGKPKNGEFIAMLADIVRTRSPSDS
ncbi:MAG: sporulation transcription factor Spo0A [Christensenellales bacterium]